MTIQDFRSLPERVAEAASSPILLTAISVLEREAPHRKPATISTETTAQIKLGQIMGFQEAIDLLALMRIMPPQPPVHIEPTYAETPEKDETNG